MQIWHLTPDALHSPRRVSPGEQGSDCSQRRRRGERYKSVVWSLATLAGLGLVAYLDQSEPGRGSTFVVYLPRPDLEGEYERATPLDARASSAPTVALSATG